MKTKRKNSSLLVADDEGVVRKLIQYHFDQAGLYCDIFENGSDLLDACSDETQTCLLDLDMPGLNGLKCLKRIKANHPSVEIIILTNVNQAAEAIEAVRSGAFDYITKPFDPNSLIRVIKKAMLLSRKQKENVDLKNCLTESKTSLKLLGNSKAMRQIETISARIAPSENAVLLTGDSGTGKTLLARVLHSQSGRSNGPFVSVSCPSLPSELLESEMFGHEKGAFSGANQRRIGRAELANGGTLFLDEIGEIPLTLQAKLLTFLQDKTFYRVGGEKPIHSDMRVIAATNQNLEEMVQNGSFREDLYFRLNVLPIRVPSLRERKSDIRVLFEYFLSKVAASDSSEEPKILDSTYALLEQHDWPGNIRELENAVIRAYTLRSNTDELAPNDFSITKPKSQIVGSPTPSSNQSDQFSLAGMTLAEIEQRALTQTLEHCGNKKSQAARMLGIAEKSIYNKIAKYGLNKN